MKKRYRYFMQCFLRAIFVDCRVSRCDTGASSTCDTGQEWTGSSPPVEWYDVPNVAVVSEPFAGREVFLDYAEEVFGAATGREWL